MKEEEEVGGKENKIKYKNKIPLVDIYKPLNRYEPYPRFYLNLFFRPYFITFTLIRQKSGIPIGNLPFYFQISICV